MPLKPEDMEKLPKEIEYLMTDLSLHILTEIVDRIKAGQEITRTTDYLIWKVAQVKEFEQGLKKHIQEVVKMTDEEINNIFDKVIEEGYAKDEALYKLTNTPYVPYEQNEELKQYVEAVKEQTKEELRNITQTTGYMVNINGKKQPTPSSMVLQDALDKAVNQVIQGTTDYNKAIKEVVQNLAESDLRTVDYATGRKFTTVQAARMCVMTAVTQVTGKVAEMNMQKLNTEFVEVSWHATARPSHQVWQGRVFHWQRDDSDNTTPEYVEVDGVRYKDFVRETEYGSMLGLCGINCYHTFYPFIPGISKRSYTDEELDKLQAEENEKHKYQGKEYTKYEATQAMRKMENRMRKLRIEIKALKEGEASPDDITNAKCRYRGLMQQYRQFADAMKLPTEMQRVYNDGLGRT